MHYDMDRFRDVSLKMVIDWLRTLDCTLPQTRSEYLSILCRIAKDLNMTWANDPCIPRYRKGLRATAPNPTQAEALSIEAFRNLREHPNELLRLAATYTFLTGSRLAETFAITPRMVTRANARKALRDNRIREGFVIIKVETGKMSKSGMTDPTALRFIDVAVLSSEEYLQLCPRLKHHHQHVFPEQTRTQLIANLKNTPYSGHSFKRGTARILSILHDEGLIQAPTIPFFLKHMNPLDPIPSVTAAYLDKQARVNILRASGVLEAAMQLRDRMVGDCYI